MRRFLVFVFVATLYLSPLLSLSQDIKAQDGRGVGINKTERKIALVIGNTNYDPSIGKLTNPVNDAGDMAKALERLGFSLVGGKAQLDVNRKQMLTLIREFGSQIKQGGIGFFYFSGHGVQVNKENYIIPITDALIYEDDAESEAVKVDMVAKEMELAGNRLNILVLDACRNNALQKRTRNTEKGLAEPARKPEGTFIAFSAGDGQTASDGKGRNGLFTQELLKNLEKSNARLDDIFRTTRNEVKRLSESRQVPVFFDSTSESFVLKTNNAVITAEIAWDNFRRTAKKLMKYDWIRTNGEEMLEAGVWVSGNMKLALLDKNGNQLTSLKYDSIDPFSEGLAVVRIGTYPQAKYGVIDKQGKEVIPITYEHISQFSDGMAEFEEKDKYGFLDKSGKIIIQPKYEIVGDFHDGYSAVSLNGNFGIIDKTGREIIPIKYDGIRTFFDEEGLIAASLNGKTGFINKQGKIIITFQYESDKIDVEESEFYIPFGERHYFSNGLVTVSLSGKWGYINNAGKTIIPFKYDFAYPFSDGAGIVGLKGKFGLVDKNGKVIAPIKYEQIGFFNNGFAEIKLNGKSGFIDIKGNIIVPIIYEMVTEFSKDGFAEVKLNGKTGFIDIKGNVVVPIIYERVIAFSEGYAFVTLNNKAGFVDQKGNEVVKPIYDRSLGGGFYEGLAEIVMNEKIGFINTKGEEVIIPKYDKTWCYAFKKEGFIGVILNGKKGFVDIYGNEYFDF